MRVYFLCGGVLFLTIYVDQMFLENFIMNYIILYATSKFSGFYSKWYRLTIGSVIGAIYVISSYIFGFYDKQLILTKVLLSAGIIFSAFNIKNIKSFLKILVFFFGITFLIGGASFGLAFFMNVSMIQDGGVLYVEEFPVIMVAVGGMAGVIIIKWISILLRRRINLKKLLYNIEISILDNKISTTVFLDSGHNVKERFTGYPVIIVENSILREVIPIEILDKIEKSNFEFEEKWRRRLRIIPISTVSNKEEVLIGFRADEAVVHTGVENKYIRKVIIAGCDRKLDNEDNYFALMGNILE